MKITIATSIAPRNIEVQQNAVSSWKKLGFSVISVNSGEEITALGRYFPDVTFKEVNRNASAIVGRPFVFFDDILKILASSGTEICGIVNSDVHLIADDDFLRFVAEQAQGGLVFGSRIDVSSLDCLEGEEYFRGFDYFFFGRDVISAYIETDFCLGSPWWDYWAPMVPIIKGFPAKQLITPVAFHIEHATRWSEQHYTDFAKKFLNYLEHEGLRQCLEDDLIALVDVNNIGHSIVPLSVFALRYINQRSAKIIYRSQHATSSGQIKSDMQNGKMSEELGYFLKRQKYFEDLFVKRICELQENVRRQELHYRNSFIWKLISPLIVLRKKFMKSQ